jgi:NTE family protein
MDGTASGPVCAGGGIIGGPVSGDPRCAGTLRFLADVGLLTDVRWVSSMSRGAAANGLLAAAMPQLQSENFSRASFDEQFINPSVDRISRESLAGRLLKRAWKIIGPDTRTVLLADQPDELFFHGVRLRDLDPGWRFIVNAAKHLHRRPLRLRA